MHCNAMNDVDQVKVIWQNKLIMYMMEIFKIFHLFGFGILFHPDHHLLGTELTPELHLKNRF